MTSRTGWLAVFGLLLSSAAWAGQSTGPLAAPPAPAPPAAPGEIPFSFDGPTPPVAPATISRDESGRATIRAVRLSAPLRLDGALDEAIYTSVPPVSDFIQVEPEEGAPATEKTEVWVTFDDDHVYVSFRCTESDPSRVVANEMRRDGSGLWQGNDIVGFLLDTFYDRRNLYQFSVNPIGGRSDGQVTNERQWNGDWNPVWDVKVGRFEGGWTVEAALPFKSLRYRPGRAQIWGFNAMRSNRWKNELSFITRIPNALGMRGLSQASLAATLVGLEAPTGSRSLEIKPYVISDLTTDRSATPRVSNDVSGDIGFDVKYGVTRNLTADLTNNTDFAQVEADEQQVNLTRFSLFFPEKREFFLENQGMFLFGGATTGNWQGPSNTPILFHSRQIGLNAGRVVPIEAGGRLTGRLGRYSLGVVGMRADEEVTSGARPTTFSVVRLRRDLLRRSSVGLLYTGRSVDLRGAGANTAYGVDGTFAFFDNLAFNTYWARTRTEGLSRDDTSYRAQMDYAGDRYGVQVERLVVGDHFNPELGFLRRDDMQRSFGLFRFSPRPRAFRSIRKFSWLGSLDYITNGTGHLETRDLNGEFAIEFQSSDRFAVSYNDTYEFLPRPFRIGPGVTLPVGGYGFSTLRLAMNLGQHRMLAGNVAAERGTFYGGDKIALSVSRGRVNLGAQLSLEPIYSVNRVELPQGSFTTHLVGSRVTHTMTPLMFVSALLQYNSAIHAVAANVRLRWEYQPGSELFVVYNEERDTWGRRFPDLANRALIVKINRLFRF
ncbi:MAG: DUF5916 domain-containing protein [Vicinamibacterales bacterium]